MATAIDPLLDHLIRAYFLAPSYSDYEPELDQLLTRRAEELGISEEQLETLLAGYDEMPLDARARRARVPGHQPNGSYYVYPADGRGRPMRSERWGPYKLESAKTFARIGATEGEHGRVVMLGDDVVRWYRRGGERAR